MIYIYKYTGAMTATKNEVFIGLYHENLVIAVNWGMNGSTMPWK